MLQNQRNTCLVIREIQLKIQCTETSGPGCKESIGETTLAIPGLHSTVNNDRLLWEPCGYQVDGRWRANTNTYYTFTNTYVLHSEIQ